MAVSFTRFSWWGVWGRKEKESVSNGQSLNSSSERGFGLRETESLKLPSVRKTQLASHPRKAKRKWKSREDRRIDTEFDVVLVPTDGVCLSESDSDESDWSIGWLEPHGPGFQSDDEEWDNNFAVLVPCYRPGCKEVVEGSNIELLSAIKNLPNKFSPEGKNYMEEWLSSLKSFGS